MYFFLINHFKMKKNSTYLNVKTIANGIMKISAKAAAFKILLAWNSTSEIKNLAPHQEFWPIIYLKNITK